MATITTYVGPADNVASISPDFLTLQEWWDDPGTEKDLVGTDSVHRVFLLPGIIDVEGTGFLMNDDDVVTDDEHYFIIAGFEGYRFEGDLTDEEIPTLTYVGSNGTVLMDIEVDYTILSGFIIKDASILTIIRHTGLGLITGVGIDSGGGVSGSFGIDIVGIDAPNCIVSNCVFNRINGIFSHTSLNKSVSVVGVKAAVVTNNVFANLTASNNSSHVGAAATMTVIDVNPTGISPGDGNYIYNNVFFGLDCETNGGTPTLNLLDSVTDYADYNAYDSTYGGLTPSGTHNVVISPVEHFQNISATSFNARLLADSALFEAGLDIRTLTNILGIDSWLFAVGILVVADEDIQGDERGTVWSIGIDDEPDPEEEEPEEEPEEEEEEEESSFTVVRDGLSESLEGYECATSTPEVKTITKLSWYLDKGAYIPAPAVCIDVKLKQKFLKRLS